MIPKKIHYCWFGGNPKPRLAQKCIKSWKRFCPDYEIKEWNEDNYDISQAPLYVRQAYEAKKWAFVTDYVRLDVVFREGGIYLDTDVEIIRSPDFLLENHAYFGFEVPERVNTGLGFGAEIAAPVVKKMQEIYGDIPFLLKDGSYDQTPCPERNTSVLEQFGLIADGTYQTLKENIIILPADYLCPVDYETGICKKTEHTVSIHWFSGSWQSKKEIRVKKAYARELYIRNILFQITRLPNKIGTGVFGEERYIKIRRFIKGHD